MEKIADRTKLAAGVVPDQELSGPYRLSSYCLRAPVEAGELWYHNLTG